MNKEKILGFDVCAEDVKQVIESILEDYSNNERIVISSINPEIIVNNYKNLDYVSKINSEKYQIPDGIGIVYASKINKGNIKTRITGIDLMQQLCEKLKEKNEKIFLCGSKPGIAKKAKENLEKKYNGINIVDVCDGYTDEQIVLKKIKESRANVLFVGLGSPKQEEFIINNKDKLESVKIFMPIGGSLDVISDNIKRAPSWMIKCNLEWLYRLIRQPKRIFRQLKIVKFIFLVIINKIKNGGKMNEKN